ncbi:hypothetical protein AGIG_G9976 [Arapaima gigas]
MVWLYSAVILVGILAFAPSCHCKTMQCIVDQHLNGSVSYFVPEAAARGPCLWDWIFNNTVIAFCEKNETKYNQTLVLTLADGSITLKTCLDTMNYIMFREEDYTAQCSCRCSAKDLSHSGMQGAGSRSHIIAVALAVAFVGTAILTFTVYCCFKKRTSLPGLGCFKKFVPVQYTVKCSTAVTV